MVGLNGALGGLKNAIETALLTAALPFLSGLERMVNQISSVIASLGAVNPQFLQTAIAIAAVLAVAGPLTMAIGFIVGIVGALISPIGLVVLALAALAAAFATGMISIEGIQTAMALSLIHISEPTRPY